MRWFKFYSKLGWNTCAKLKELKLHPGWLAIILLFTIILFRFYSDVQPRVLLNTVEPGFLGFYVCSLSPTGFVLLYLFSCSFLCGGGSCLCPSAGYWMRARMGLHGTCFSVIINNCNSMTNLKNLMYTLDNKINIDLIMPGISKEIK
jgi:hypothetical protein